ncbi:MAG TPA: peptidylprolyl isomerase [Vicinamibacteria bacterium]|nr:peptidylprolyl isomerase [Vicinamibacteria bacterium]
MVLAVAQASAPGTAPKADAAAKPAAADPVVVLDTSLGVIKIELNRAKAPVTVDNFLKYVKAKHYDGTIFHRVIPDFMIQGGGMDESMTEKSTGAPIKNEARNGLRNERGTIAMARLNPPDSATAQFFINVKNNSALDYGINGAGYAVFGRVIEGMDVVDKIRAVRTTTKRPHENVPVTPVVIKTARLAP